MYNYSQYLGAKRCCNAQGAQGAQGATGAQGAQGTQGAQGVEGSSPWYSSAVTNPVTGDVYDGYALNDDAIVLGNLYVSGKIDPTSVTVTNTETMSRSTFGTTLLGGYIDNVYVLSSPLNTGIKLKSYGFNGISFETNLSTRYNITSSGRHEYQGGMVYDNVNDTLLVGNIKPNLNSDTNKAKFTVIGLFANAVERDVEIPSPFDGQMCLLSESRQFQCYNATLPGWQTMWQMT